jgi:autotransporter-associated beta strand protein
MKKTNHPFRFSSFSPMLPILIGMVVAGAVLLSNPLHAAILNWTGGGGANANWNNSANWGGAGTPQNFDTLVFSAGQPNLINTNNISNLNLNQIIFTGAGGGYSLYGNTFMITNSLTATNTAGANTIYNNINFSNLNVTILVSNGVSLNLAGSLSATVFATNVIKIGLGTLIYSGSTANTYTNLTTVNEGELDLAKSGNVAAIAPFGAGLVIGDGSGTDTVRYLGNNQIWSIVTPITITSSGVLDLNGYSDTASPFTLNGGQITTGAGMLTVSGTVKIGGTATVSGKVGLSSTLIITNAVASTILQMNAGVSGSYGITKTGVGYLFLSASNSYTGLTAVQQGWIYAQNNFALGTTNSGTVVSNGATLVLQGNIGITNEALTLNGLGVGSGWGALDVETGTNTWAGPITNNANSTLDSWNPGAALHIAGPISGAGGLELFGGGSHYFEGSTSNTYAGTTTVDANTTLLLNKSSVFDGAIPQNLVINGTVRLLNYNQIANTSGVTVNSGGLLDVAALFEGIDTLSGSGDVSLSGGDLYLGYGNGSSTFSGVISGPNKLVKEGSGTITLAGSTANTYAGHTYVNGGTLVLNKSVANGAIPGDLYLWLATTVRLGASEQIANTANIVMQGGTLDLNNYNETIGTNLLFWEGSTVMTGSGVLTLSPNSTVLHYTASVSHISGKVNIGSGDCTMDVEGGVLFVPASVSGTANLVKSGPAELDLQSSNSYSGLTIIAAGYLALENSWALGSTASGTIVSNNGCLFLMNNIGITNESLTLYGPGAGGGNLYCNDLSTNYWVGPIALNGNCLVELIAYGCALHLNGPISGPGGLTETNSSSPLYLEGTTANTYAGTTTVSSGTLVLNKSASIVAIPTNLVINGTVSLNASQQIADTADVLVNSGGLFDLGTCYEYINTLRGPGTVNFGSGGWIYLGLNNGTSTFDGSFTGIGYAPGWTVGKTGSGTFTMTGTNTFSAGNTTIAAGKMVINGYQPQSPVLVYSGATLGGLGTVGPITANGIISPGNSPGILSSSNVTFSSSGNFTVELTGPTPGNSYDQMNVRGTNALANATLTVIPAFTTPVPIGQQFTIINNDLADAIAGTFSGLANGAQFSAGGYTFRINYGGGDGNDVVLTLWGVPGNTVTLNAVDKGWYDSTGYHYLDNQNYYAGQGDSGTNLYRDWFVFNVPVFTNSIIHAELLINCYSNSSPRGQEIYLLRKVTTSVATLEAGGSGLVGIYNDLGTGAVYSVRSIATDEAGQKAIIPLNLTFINDATAASGSQMALGGSVATLDATNNHNQYLFAYSGGPSDDIQLRLIFGTNLVINSANRGWYNNLGTHTASNPNYLAGDLGGTFYRDFFVFNLPALSSQLMDAQLLVNAYTCASPDGVATYQLYDVTNSITVLTNNASGATGVYADLGSGTVYGGRNVYVTESGLILGIPLDGNFLGAALANSGGRIALGGALASLNSSPTNKLLFRYSAGLPADAQLWLGFLAAPVSRPSFVGGTPAYLGNNQFQFVVSGTAGTTNEIQGTFDYQNWDFICDLVMTNSTTSFRYTNNTAVPCRYFRAEQLP